jgi:hypothetical protein
LRSIIGEGASGLEARALGDHWALDRKLREFLGAQGIGDEEARRSLEIMRALLARTSPGESPDSAGKQGAVAALKPPAAPELSPAEKLILDNYHEEDFRRLLGVNVFDGVVWFNKEAFEETLFYASLFTAMESEAALQGLPHKGRAGTKAEGAWLDRVAKIAELADAFAAAEQASAYRLDGLLKALETGAPLKT